MDLSGWSGQGLAENRSHAGEIGDFWPDPEPVTFCRTNGCFVAGLGRKTQSGGIGGRIVFNTARRDHDYGNDQRQCHCKIR